MLRFMAVWITLRKPPSQVGSSSEEGATETGKPALSDTPRSHIAFWTPRFLDTYINPKA